MLDITISPSSENQFNNHWKVNFFISLLEPMSKSNRYCVYLARSLWVLVP